jgi:hypothetical protein
MPMAMSRGVAPVTSRLHSSSTTNAPPKDDDAASGSSTETDAAQPTSTASQPSTEQQTDTEPKRKLTIAEQDALAFKQLDDREGSGAGNEILDGEYEKGMTRNTRKNQYRVI